MKSTDIKNHKTSISQTHNLEVPGSSPGWSTKKVVTQVVTTFFLYPVSEPNLLLPLIFAPFQRIYSMPKVYENILVPTRL